MNTQDFKRAKVLADLDLDYQELKSDFQDLSILAAKVAGTELSEVNFIDNYTQWTVAGSAGEFSQKPREASICNITITEDHQFESRVDLDLRFKDSSYVQKEGYKYYYGIPLKLNGEITIGTLCIGGKTIEDLSENQVEQLHLIAKQIESQILLKQKLRLAQKQALEERKLKRRLAHDVRSPLSGIAQLIELTDHSKEHHEELIDILNLIASSTTSVLQLVEDILSVDTNKSPSNFESDSFFTLESLTQKLIDLYSPQAQAKDIELNYEFQPNALKFSRNNLLPMIGNLISNSIKFTETGGQIDLKLEIEHTQNTNNLSVLVSDTGIGMSAQQVDDIIHKQVTQRKGTSGEKGYGIGLIFVKQLCEELAGNFTVESKPEEGTRVKLNIPLKQ